MSIDAAMAEIKLKNYDEALIILDEIIASAPGNRMALYEAAKIYYHKGEYAKACGCLDTALKSRKNWPGALSLLGKCCILLGQYDAAMKAYRSCTSMWRPVADRTYTDFFRGTCDGLLDMYVNSGYAQSEWLDAVDQVCLGDADKNGATSWQQLYQGIVAYQRGKTDEAAELFQNVRLVKDMPFGRHASGARSMRSQAYVRNLNPELRSDMCDFKWVLKGDVSSVDNVVLISCDSVYLHNYGITAIRSALYQTEALIHVNVVNPQIADRIALSEIEALFPGRVSVTCQMALVDNFKCIYACSRFLIMPELMEFYRKPILSIDADSGIIAKIPFEEMSKHDICYKSAKKIKQAYFPWRTVAVGILYFNANKAALYFSKLYRSYLLSVLDTSASSEEFWYVDQSAFICIQAVVDGVSFYNLGPRTSSYCRFPNFATETKAQFAQQIEARMLAI